MLSLATHADFLPRRGKKTRQFVMLKKRQFCVRAIRRRRRREILGFLDSVFVDFLHKTLLSFEGNAIWVVEVTETSENTF